MITKLSHPGKASFSPAKQIGQVLARYMRQHPDFYLFSPDETTSNKLDTVDQVSSRAWNLPRETYDLPETTSGQIVELLSENALFATMAGHLISGGQAVMTSYEAFFTIITSQILQQLKFFQQSQSVNWRPPYPSVNLLSTSTCWRQDHNGFTHQSPALISTLLTLPSNLSNCLFPLDDVAAESALIYALHSTNRVNLITFNKTEQPRYLTSPAADAQFSQGGASILDFASDDDPDYIFVGIGDIVSNEALRALQILRQDFPEKRFRFVNISALSYNAIGTTDRKLTASEFNHLFTAKRPIIINFHGYPATIAQIFAHYTDPKRLHLHGYIEQGSTTTPFEMLSLNQASRYHLASDVARLEQRPDLVKSYQHILNENRAHAHRYGIDKIA